MGLHLTTFLHLFYTAFITGLLNNIGTHVDPILLIHRIKEGMEIPNLRDSLVKILQDYNLQVNAAHVLSVSLLLWYSASEELKNHFVIQQPEMATDYIRPSQLLISRCLGCGTALF